MKKSIGFAIIPKGPIIDFIVEKEKYLSKKYNTLAGLKQPPNITIKWPFEVEDINPFLDYFKKIAQEINPFEIQVRSTGFFKESKALFLRVESSEELIKLHLRILKDLKEKFGIEKNWYEGKNQQFHITLAYKDISYDNFKKAKEEILKWKVDFKFIFESIGFFIYEPNRDKWDIVAEIKVGKNG